MAVIGTIRKKFGTLLIIIVGLALAAFVLGDLFKARPKRQEVYLGEIGSEKISYRDFDQKFELNKKNQLQQQNKSSLTAEEIFRLKENTWKQMVNNILFNMEYDKIGMAVSTDELFDQIQGDNPHPWIVRYFKNEVTNEYDPELVRNYLKQLDGLSSEQKQQWYNFEKSIKENRISTKYKDLLTKSFFVPDTFLHKTFTEQRASANIRVIGLNSTLINDSLVVVTDDEMKDYYNENKFKYLQEEPSREIDYVIFDVQPSSEDMDNIKNQVMNIYSDFQSTSNVFSFVHLESDNGLDSSFRKVKDLPLTIATQIVGAEVGKFVEPYIENDAWHMAKLIDVQERPDSLKAKHILFSYAGAYGASSEITRLKVTAESLADSILNVVKKNPSQFTALAKELSDDPSAQQNDGDLGWFADGVMVPEFNNAVYNGEIGDFVKVETQFGFHIILVDGKKDFNEKYKVAIIDIGIEPSQDTYQQKYAEASEFKIKATSPQTFDTLVEYFNLSKRNAPYLTPMQNSISGLQYPRGIIQWSFREGVEVGSVSDIFSQEEDRFIIAIVTKATEAGYAPFEDVKETIEPLLKKEKKIELLVDRLNSTLKSAKSFDEIAAMQNTTVDTISAVTFNMRSVGRYGAEEKLLAKVFEMETDVISKPIYGNNNAFIFVVDEVVPAPAEGNFAMYERQLKNPFENAVRNDAFIKMLKDKCDFIDNRYKFY